MYNQLKVEDEFLRFQLFLFHQTLDIGITPEIWVLTSAWYGVVTTGNQAGFAIEMLAETFKDRFKHAVEPLTEYRYVDDVTPGADSIEEREQQIEDVHQVLEKGGFQQKYVIRSGQPPPETATTDGVSIKMLGYKIDTEKDLLFPGLTELNLNKKVRGSQKPNTNPISTAIEARSLLVTLKLTKRIIMAKTSEFFDPIGLFEPVRVQLKLALTRITKYDWDDILPSEIQEEWVTRLSDLTELAKSCTKRSVIPINTLQEQHHIRLLCLSDAGAQAGGAAVYVGVQLPDGNFSCQLLTAKSRIMDSTIPRNELSAIMHMAELSFTVKKAAGLKVKEIVYVTDSTIALSWCNNMNIKLRLYVHNRVESIKRLIAWTLEDREEIPLYHIDGKLNLADLLTKPRNITEKDVGLESKWQNGLHWMTLPTCDLPITSYNDINLPSKERESMRKECYDENFLISSNHLLLKEELSQSKEIGSHLAQNIVSSPERKPFFLDLIGKGWFRSISMLTYLWGCVDKWRHICHINIQKSNPDCILCSEHVSTDFSYYTNKAYQTIFKHETAIISKLLMKKDIEKFSLHNGILMSHSRLSTENPFRFEDLDGIPFLDAPEIVGKVPVVLADSDIFQSFLIAVHTQILPHAGVQATMKEIQKKMFVPNNPRKWVSKIRSDCSKCRLISKKTIELEMQAHAPPRTMIAPVFYNSMMDIAYGFTGKVFKNARKTYKLYALVVVCLLSGATNILVLEGLETQDITQALERHAVRYGVPSELFVDNGTQLKAMKHANFSIQTLDTYTRDSMGMKVSVSNPKSHEERGRVERKIGLVKNMLEKMTVGNTMAQSAVQWETLFAKIANTLDNLPMAKGNTSNVSVLGYEILTPNRLKLGRNNHRSLAGEGITLEATTNPLDLLEQNRQIYKVWYELFMDNIHALSLRPNKWHKSGKQAQKEDIVLFIVDDSISCDQSRKWKLGKVIEVSDKSLKIRHYTETPKTKQMSAHTIIRSPRDVTIILSLEDSQFNSRNYFQKQEDTKQKTSNE